MAAQQVSAAMAAMVVEKVAAMVEGREVAKGRGRWRRLWRRAGRW